MAGRPDDKDNQCSMAETDHCRHAMQRLAAVAVGKLIMLSTG